MDSIKEGVRYAAEAIAAHPVLSKNMAGPVGKRVRRDLNGLHGSDGPALETDQPQRLNRHGSRWSGPQSNRGGGRAGP